VSNSDDDEDDGGRRHYESIGDVSGRGYRGLVLGYGPGSRRLGMEEEGISLREEGVQETYLDQEEGDDDSTTDDTFQRARATLFRYMYTRMDEYVYTYKCMYP
jgi:hypothetical protein